jgi:hypothetical protein
MLKMEHRRTDEWDKRIQHNRVCVFKNMLQYHIAGLNGRHEVVDKGLTFG